MQLNQDEEIVRHGGWIGPGEAGLMAWWTAPRRPSSSGVLVLPPVGYTYWPAHQTLRQISERLAAVGHHVLRLDYVGTGDSTGSQWDGDRVAAWRTSVREGGRALRTAGCERISVLGVQLGGLLALLEAAWLEADHVVAWAPVTDGPRFVRQLRMLGEPIPHGAPAGRSGDLVSGGVVLNAETQASLGRLGLGDVSRPPPHVTVVDLAASERVTVRLQELGAQVSSVAAPDGAFALERPTEDAEIPPQTVREIVAAIGPAGPASSGPGALPALQDETVIDHDGVEVVERLVLLGPDGLVGVRCEPSAPAAGPVVLLLNSGSETHVGAGRTWVEYARGMAAAGVSSIRLDFRGWGESPNDGLAPGRPYDAQVDDDVVNAVEALRAVGEEAVLAGLCAAAWVSLDVARRLDVAGVVALNPPLFWSRGDPIITLIPDERIVRRDEIEAFKVGRRSGRWDHEDAHGHRHPAAVWLDELAARQVPISMIFSERDDGLEFLEDRIGATISRLHEQDAIDLVEIPEVDHAAHRAWLRPLVLAELLAAYRRIEVKRLREAAGRGSPSLCWARTS